MEYFVYFKLFGKARRKIRCQDVRGDLFSVFLILIDRNVCPVYNYIRHRK